MFAPVTSRGVKQARSGLVSTLPLLPTKSLNQAAALRCCCVPPGGPLEQVLHGDISQHQRDLTIKAFRAKGFQVLVATDVAARGIDVSDIDLVVQYRPPRDTGEEGHQLVS